MPRYRSHRASGIFASLDLAAGRYRENSQAKDWIGHAVARVMGLDMSNKAHKATVIESLKRWRASGMFVAV